jgi:hypothetical protein
MTLFTSGPDVLVDLSNVCRDSSLLRPGERASWGIFEHVVKAMHRAPIELGRVHAVADRSLFPLLDDYGKKQLKTFRKKGLLEETPLADERLIGYLFDEDSPFQPAAVLSRDMFDDFRRDYPQIQGARDLFLEWNGTDLKTLQVQWRNMQQRTHRRISRKIEVGEMKARRLLRDTVRDRAMATDFRCINGDCALAQLWPDRLLEFPTYDRNIDGFVCPSCGQKLESLGRRSATTQILVYFDGEEQLRVLLEDGAKVLIGRDDRKGCVGLSRSLSPDLVEAVSGEHVEFAMGNGRVTIADVGSKNGTMIEPRSGGGTRGLEAGNAVTFDGRLRALLPGGISIELSGQIAPFEGERPISETIAAPRAVLETVIELG